MERNIPELQTHNSLCATLKLIQPAKVVDEWPLGSQHVTTLGVCTGCALLYMVAFSLLMTPSSISEDFSILLYAPCKCPLQQQHIYCTALFNPSDLSFAYMQTEIDSAVVGVLNKVTAHEAQLRNLSKTWGHLSFLDDFVQMRPCSQLKAEQIVSTSRDFKELCRQAHLLL